MPALANQKNLTYTIYVQTLDRIEDLPGTIDSRVDGKRERERERERELGHSQQSVLIVDIDDVA